MTSPLPAIMATALAHTYGMPISQAPTVEAEPEPRPFYPPHDGRNLFVRVHEGDVAHLLADPARHKVPFADSATPDDVPRATAELLHTYGFRTVQYHLN